MEICKPCGKVADKLFPCERADCAVAAAERREESEQLAHTDHPLRHWDRTCPACVLEGDALVRAGIVQVLPLAPQPETTTTSTHGPEVLHFLDGSTSVDGVMYPPGSAPSEKVERDSPTWDEVDAIRKGKSDIDLAERIWVLERAHAEAIEEWSKAEGALKGLRSATPASVIDRLSAMADAAYVHACHLSKDALCLGEEHKIKTGAFTLDNLKALENVRAEFGKAFGLWDAIKELRAADKTASGKGQG